MKKKRDELAVGVFAVVAFLLLALILFFVSKVDFFKKGYPIDVMFENVSILDRGAPVRLAGVRVGEVRNVELVYDETEKHTRVRVRLFIGNGIEIKSNYEFTVQGTHILSEPHIEIRPKTDAEGVKVLRAGDLIEGVKMIEMDVLMERGKELLENLTSVSGKINEGLGDDGDIKKSLQNIESSTSSLSEVLAKIKSGKGTLGKLIEEESIYQDVDSLVKDVKSHPWKLLRKDNASKRKWYFLWLA